MSETEVTPPEHEAVLRALDPRKVITPLTREERRTAAELRVRQADDAYLLARAELEDLREPGEDEPEPTQTTKAKTLLGLRTLDEVLDEELPPLEWIWEPYLDADSIGCMVAPPNLGKTLLAFYAATEAAAKGLPVVIIEMEGGRRGFKKRISRAAAAAGGREKCHSIRTSFKPHFSLLDPRSVAKLIEECAGAKLIIIDSLACATPGLEENDVTAMGQVVRSLQLIQTETGAALLILHHTVKTKWKPGETPGLGDGRGSGALDAAIDSVLGLAPIPELQEVSGFVSFMLYNTKQRDEEKVPARLVRIAMAGVSANVEIMDPHLEKFREQAQEARDEIWTHVPESQMSAKSKSKVLEECEINRQIGFKVINEMIMDGTIKVHQGRVYRGTQMGLEGVADAV